MKTATEDNQEDWYEILQPGLKTVTLQMTHTQKDMGDKTELTKQQEAHGPKSQQNKGDEGCK